MKVLDIAPDRTRRREFSRWISACGHERVVAAGRREALQQLRCETFDLAVLDASSDLYDTREFVRELVEGAQDVIIAVVVEPRNRPPRHRIAGRASNVFFLQDGSVDHMAKVLDLVVSVREGNEEPV